ncbi:efflux RND transporter periplasmic adaptor subunit [Testudinibacter sp. TR-2022]|uniref:efflux RND transporter periplasmic adaptor subunit n=1 Tax=Testudinibacter sp. TR-2022 TaxID=2585029 RepID=UPI00111B4B6F|nr:efflux RND transporter periplasmic adaptor subunit [Testudinibacter sp. TR-2022]TNH00507.1 efflux RND transporter periplasmic adaptor subunit [Pasteurellaceae bacterium Phil31]TNH07607.1 efflux RND transporter periplasmic adaptor subunit [Testudinibacter sp. TR-2022]TNH10618.1 efflux RND transporter periplasmic adaptor subunit [Testudinibacter sp. TR-2022]TNH11950.1 efflux RND transporter periplasmic adaptor subunit [Testudinibacter sp. TR-2022]TNH17021.1 efflux RND transporter periplasmic 
MKAKKIKTIALAAVMLTILFGGYYYWQNSAGSDNKTTYMTETVNRTSLSDSVIATGTVRSYNRVEVGAQVSGQLLQIHVGLGQKVKKGDLIAEIDAKNQNNELATALAQLASYQAQLNAAQANLTAMQSSYDRINRLYKQKSATQDSLETARVNLANAQSTIAQLQSSIKQAEISVTTAQTNLDYTKILAPIDGTIISIPVSEGQTVNSNQTAPTIVQVADLSKMLIKAEISEGDISKVKAGMKVRFTTLADPKKVYQSEIASIDPALTTLTDNDYSESSSDSSAVYFYANIVIDNPDETLRIGMTTQNTITIVDAENVLTIPTMAIQKVGEQYQVRVLTADNKTETRRIEIGISDDMNTQVLSGLAEGDEVISAEMRQGEEVGNSGQMRMRF